MITGSVFCMEIGNAMKSTNFKGCEDKIQSPGVRIISNAKRWPKQSMAIHNSHY